MNNKIMAGATLENIYGRLSACLALMRVAYADMDDHDPLCEAMYGVCDLMQSILKDFSADIEATTK